MSDDEGPTAPVPHQHGGTDAPECTPFGIPCRPSTPADDGLPAAVANLKREFGFTNDEADRVARAAREDYGDLVASVAALCADVAEAPLACYYGREGHLACDCVEATVREAEVEAWDEGFEAATEHASAYTHGNNGPPDPPRNPFLRAGEA